MIEVAIAGVGMTPFGRFPDRRIDAMGSAAVAEALDAAGISGADIDGVWCGNVLGGGSAGQRSIAEAGIEGVPVQNIENACASGSHAFAEAFAAVRRGQVRAALVIGVESAASAFDGLITLDRDDAPTRLGLNLPGIYAMNASRYLAEHRADPRALAAVSVKNRRGGVNNPRARFREPVTVDDVLESRPIAEPLTLLQCCANADGAAAVVLVPADSAHANAVRVLGCGVSSGFRIDADYDLSRSRITETAAARAFADAGIGPERIDIAEVHDAFTIGELIALESLGLAERGTAWRMTLEGETSPGGALPVNTSGGLLSRGHAVGASGVAQVVELTRQLLGSSENPTPGASVALAHTVGGGVATHDGVASVVSILARPGRRTMTAQRARDVIASEAVCRSVGISVVDNDDRRATLEMPVTAEMVTSLGFAHAGYILMLADTASGAVALAVDPGAITTGADVSFLGPARFGDVLVAEAELRAQSGRSLLIDVAVRSAGEVPRRIAEFRARAHVRTKSSQ